MTWDGKSSGYGNTKLEKTSIAASKLLKALYGRINNMASPEKLYGRPWSEKEFIVALDYYFKNIDKPRHYYCDHVVALSEILGRTPASIVMRMENFSSIDPDSKDGKKGLININRLCRRVFDEWSEKRGSLSDCAQAFVRDSQQENMPDLFNPNPIAVPKAFDQYELVDQIGEGGTGIVFSCLNTENGKPYALKILKSDHLYDEEAKQRFVREIHAIKSKDHNHVIKIHHDNLSTEKRFPAFVMDLALCSLTYFISEKSPTRPLSDTIDSALIFRSICQAAIELHTNKPHVLHRDINPNNILLMEDGRWVLSDFGLAKFISTAPISTTFQTMTQLGLGTTWYTAPEQYRNFKETSEKTDIYSLGILLWELFSEHYAPPDVRQSGLPENLEYIYSKATNRDQNERYNSVSNLLEEFNQVNDSTD